jgi:eukaryotic-like serine/threonine-protein kinase
MGAVYEVVDRPTRRRRALKVMLTTIATDPALRARFELEARVTANVESEHIVETFDAGVDADTGSPFLVMELLRGKDLGALLAERRRLHAVEVIALLKQAAMALDRTHAAGIVHRDLKPENLFIARRDDGSEWVKILDFGIAKLVAQSSQSYTATSCVGTPTYMSPEQIRGDGNIGPPADIYALAHIAYTMLVGEAYWETEARSGDGLYALLLRLSRGAAEPASVRASAAGVSLPAAFDRWFARATSANAASRLTSAGALVRELAAVFDLHPAPLTHGARDPERPALPRRAAGLTPQVFAPTGAGVALSGPPHARSPRRLPAALAVCVALAVGGGIWGALALRSSVIAPVRIAASGLPPVTATVDSALSPVSSANEPQGARTASPALPERAAAPVQSQDFAISVPAPPPGVPLARQQRGVPGAAAVRPAPSTPKSPPVEDPTDIR